MLVKRKIIVIVGPTASGKSALAIRLAKKFNGEVISADSRQVYKGLDIGTGKVTKKEMAGVKHYMLDIASPKRVYTVNEYKKDAERCVEQILRKNKVPIVCGGTGFYIDAIVYDRQFPEVPVNEPLRQRLSKYSVEKLFSILKEKDPERAKAIGEYNKVRLIRAIEIVKALGKVPPLPSAAKKYDALIIGIKTDQKILKDKIKKRLHARIRQGMIAEVSRLHKEGVSWGRMEALGLEYRYISGYLRGLISKEDMIEKLNTEIWHYARRQMTWWRKNKHIRWYKI